MLISDLLQESHLTLNHAVEVVGKVQQDLTVKCLATIDFGPNFGENFRGSGSVCLS